MSYPTKGSGSKKAEKGHLELLSEKKAFSILVDGLSPSTTEGKEAGAVSEVFADRRWVLKGKRQVDDILKIRVFPNVGTCSGPNVCVPPKFVSCGPHPQCDDTWRWGTFGR